MRSIHGNLRLWSAERFYVASRPADSSRPAVRPMHVAVGYISLRVPDTRTPKTRRQAARSLIQRIRGRFNVSVAQDAGADGNAWQSVTLAVSCVGVTADQTRSLIDDVVDFVIEVRPDLEILDYTVEVMAGF